MFDAKSRSMGAMRHATAELLEALRGDAIGPVRLARIERAAQAVHTTLPGVLRAYANRMAVVGAAVVAVGYLT